MVLQPEARQRSRVKKFTFQLHFRTINDRNPSILPDTILTSFQSNHSKAKPKLYSLTLDLRVAPESSSKYLVHLDQHSPRLFLDCKLTKTTTPLANRSSKDSAIARILRFAFVSWPRSLRDQITRRLDYPDQLRRNNSERNFRMFSSLSPKVSGNQFNRDFTPRDASIHRCNYGLAEDPFRKRIFVTFKRHPKGSPFRRAAAAAAAARPSLRQFFQFATEEKGGGTVHPRDETPRPVRYTAPRIYTSCR